MDHAQGHNHEDQGNRDAHANHGNDADEEGAKKPADALQEDAQVSTGTVAPLPVREDEVQLLLHAAAIARLRPFFIRSYRRGTLAFHARQFCEHCISLAGALGMPFPQLKSLMDEPRVKRCAAAMLRKLIAGVNGRRNPPLIVGVVSPKIFLASYMIAAHPNHMFEDVSDPLAIAVQGCSQPMIVRVEAVAARMRDGATWGEIKNSADGQALGNVLCDYLREFKRWKTVDEQRLAGRIVHALRGLDNAENTLQRTPRNAAMLNDIRQRRRSLEEKLLVIGGQAALDNYRNTVPAAPALAPAAGAPPPAHQPPLLQPVQNMTNAQLAHCLLLDPNFEIGDGSEGKIDMTSLRRPDFGPNFWENVERDLSPGGTLLPTASSASFRRALAVIEYVRGNLIDLSASTFPVEEERNQQVRKIEETLDMQRIALHIGEGGGGGSSSGGGSNNVEGEGAVAEAGESRVAPLAPAAASLFASIFEIIASFEQGIFLQQTPPATGGGGQKQQPTRVSETPPATGGGGQKQQQKCTRASMPLWEAIRERILVFDHDSMCARALCDALKLAADSVYYLRLGVANKKLRAIAKTIAEHGVGYERANFRRRIEQVGLEAALESTRKWVRYEVRRIEMTPVKQLDGAGTLTIASLRRNPRMSIPAFLCFALVDLIAEFPHWGGERRIAPVHPHLVEMPETLDLDRILIAALHSHLHTDVMCAVIVTILDQELRRRLMFIPHEELPPLLDEVCKVVIEAPPKPHLIARQNDVPGAETVTRVMQVVEARGAFAVSSSIDLESIQRVVEQDLRPTHPVYVHILIVFKRLWRGVLERSILGRGSGSGSSSSSSSRAGPSAPGVGASPDALPGVGEWQLPEAVRAIVEHTEKNAKSLVAATKLNIVVHRNFYEDMIAASVAELQPQQAQGQGQGQAGN